MIDQWQKDLLRQIVRQKAQENDAENGPLTFDKVMKAARELASSARPLTKSEQAVMDDFEASYKPGPPKPKVKAPIDR